MKADNDVAAFLFNQWRPAIDQSLGLSGH